MIALLLRSAAAVLLAALLSVTGPTLRHVAAGQSHFADAEDVALVTKGKHAYMDFCAACHGRNLQGQPLWQLEDKFVGRRAPAHDETGHTWQHSDEDLFRKTRDGRFPSEPADVASTMPGFAAILDDDVILAALAFIKARWPLGLRVSQAMLNPDFAGIPKNANEVEWRLPPNCNVLLRRQAATSIQ